MGLDKTETFHICLSETHFNMEDVPVILAGGESDRKRTQWQSEASLQGCLRGSSMQEESEDSSDSDEEIVYDGGDLEDVLGDEFTEIMSSQSVKDEDDEKYDEEFEDSCELGSDDCDNDYEPESETTYDSQHSQPSQLETSYTGSCKRGSRMF